ncbi:unnamed protein product [Adineta steineri]|uniref:JmjC domain-containing protein n=1 Tax=Adineta steineri TaxID=433720 RepID=A0A819R0V5_9BILA|nr:unnamed protein product [Adineta steineri]CAF4034565.1 unnamed protein product [Adineta steineri]
MEKNLNQFSSSLIKTQGHAAIFPLFSSKENFFQLNYYYQGEIHNWYLLSWKERLLFKNVLEEKQPSIYIEHKNIFIDPSMHYEYTINYHRIIQYPNEIIILSCEIL